jgi:hypothetical protein
MSKKNLFAFAIFLALLPIFSAGEIKAQTSNSRIFSERFIIQAVRTIHSAETTYQAVFGAGAYGSLAQLRQADFIDAALAGGEKNGYRFVLTATPPTATLPAKFKLTATPRTYSKQGRRSFYIDEEGELHGADKNGALADANDPVIDACSLYGDTAGNESCAISAMRLLYSAEMTYRATAGSGSFGVLTNLYLANLIGRTLASGQTHGYNFAVTVDDAPNPSFKAVATPQNYGVTGRRSFYIGMDGIVRGGDRQGGNADENDPPVESN